MRRMTWVVLAALLGAGVGVGTAAAQLRPTRAYYGVDRPVPMTVAAMDDGRVPDQVRLLAAGTGEELARGAVEAPEAEGPAEVDLARVLPRLWGMEAGRVMYAQAYSGDEPIGAPVVLQPMVTPAYAARVDRDGAPAFVVPTGRARAFTGYRAYVDRLVVMETDKGPLTIALRPDAAPNAAWAFRELVDGGFYTDIRVHRVASLSGRAEADVIQFGDPSVRGTPALSAIESKPATTGGSRPAEKPPVKAGEPGSSTGGTGGLGGAGFYVDLEPSPLKHDFGVISLARGADPNSGSSQVVIALGRERCASMDGRYAAFAEVVGEMEGAGGSAGAATLMAIAHTPVDADYRTITPPVIRSARLVDAPPYPKRAGRVVDPRTRPVER